MDSGSMSGYSANGDGETSSPSDGDELFDGVAPSTAAMAILFGSVMCATVGMAARSLLWGDRRAINAALSIEIDNTITNNTKHCGSCSSASHEHDEYYAEKYGSRSVTSRLSTLTNGAHTTKTQIIRPWEPTFISTFVLFYQMSLFGLILFIIYLIDNHPPYGMSKSYSELTGHTRMSTESAFDDDQFMFMILSLVGYGYYVSWGRNDGRPEKSEPDSPSVSQSLSDQQSACDSLNERIIRSRRKFVRRGSTGSGGESIEGSENRRLEEVLLDDDTSFDNILDNIKSTGDDMHSDKKSWLDQGSRILGFLIADERMKMKTGVVHDARPEEDILNRCQTLEWKGFLSAALLIFKYNNGGKISFGNIHIMHNDDEASLGAHMSGNLAKWAVTSFIFLSGYSHMSFFYYQPSKNQRMSRVIIIIFRVSFAAMFLSLVNGQMEYVTCLMVTYWFLVIWATIQFHRSVNYDKYMFRLKLFGLAVYIFLMWDCDVSRVFGIIPGIFQMWFEPLWECYCHLHLHHWAAFSGMIFAINHPIASYQLRKLEASRNILTNVMAKAIIGIALGLATIIWAKGPLQRSSSAYNISQPYFGIVPVLTLIYWRNITIHMREHHIGLFKWLGKYSLEIYLLHYHAFTENGCIQFMPGYPRCNFGLVTGMLLLVARALHHLSIKLRNMILPENDERKCIQNSASIVVGISALYLLARVLKWANMMTLGTTFTLTIACGILIFQTVVDMTWDDYRGAAIKLDKDESAVKISPQLLGAVVVVMAWSAWSFCSGTYQPCDAIVNDGFWAPINPCLSREKFHRSFHAANYIKPTDCLTSNNTHLEWSWPEKGQHAHCRFRHRNEFEVQQKLSGRNIVLIGDSSVHSLFISLCHVMGDHDAHLVEDAKSHSDAVKTIGSTKLEYKWAPLSVDISTKLKGMRNSPRHPDLVIAGGGAYNKLHIDLTDEDPQSQREAIIKLAKSLSQVVSPVVWFTPPTINTRALNSDEKRTSMSEESVEETRKLYEELGVTSSATFVLDGPSFTRERVSLSYDGIHYPQNTMDAGAQILFNAFDWLIDSSAANDALFLPEPGSLGKPFLGLMMMCVTLIGLFFFDGYFGVSYLAQIFSRETVSPSELYEAAFTPIFKRLKMRQKDDVREEDDASNCGGNSKHEMTALLGRSGSSLSRRR